MKDITKPVAFAYIEQGHRPSRTEGSPVTNGLGFNNIKKLYCLDLVGPRHELTIGLQSSVDAFSGQHSNINWNCPKKHLPKTQ